MASPNTILLSRTSEDIWMEIPEPTHLTESEKTTQILQERERECMCEITLDFMNYNFMLTMLYRNTYISFVHLTHMYSSKINIY